MKSTVQVDWLVARATDVAVIVQGKIQNTVRFSGGKDPKHSDI